MVKKYFYIILFSICALTFNSHKLYAPPAPPAGGATPPCWPPPCIPIDGATVLLVAAGMLIGGREIMKLNHKSSKA